MSSLLMKIHCTRLRLLHASQSATIRSLTSSVLIGGSAEERSWNSQTQNTGWRRVFGETHYIQCRNAGHSKWANIKHQKSLMDHKKAVEHEKYIRAIRNAAKENQSADPKVNKKLADVIDRAKSAKVPSAAIQKALDFVSRGLNKADFKQFLYFLRGPGSCVMIAVMESDNATKLKMDLSPVLRKNGFVVGSDSLLHMFEKKGIILCTGLNGTPLTEERLEECVDHAIEAEAEEVNWIESPLYGFVMEFTTEPNNFFKVCKNLEGINYEIVYSEIDYLPKTLVELDNDQLSLVARFHQKLEEYADVVKIYDNIA